jgi:hypothetical protein
MQGARASALPLGLVGLSLAAWAAWAYGSLEREPAHVVAAEGPTVGDAIVVYVASAALAVFAVLGVMASARRRARWTTSGSPGDDGDGRGGFGP